MNGVPAPLFSVSPAQITGQVPNGTAPGTASAVVRLGNHSGEPVAFAVAPTAPGIFSFAPDRCVALNADQTINLPSNPAQAGKTIFAYLTGVGQVDNPVPSGAATPQAPLSRVVAPASAEIGNRAASLSFLGLSPGLVGVARATIEVPANLAAGDHDLSLTVGGASTNRCRVSVLSPVQVIPAPVITGVSPASGLPAGGDAAAISGGNFRSGARVLFGPSPAASVAFGDASTIRAVTPPGAGTVDVTVINPDGQSAALRQAFTYQPPKPAIEAQVVGCRVVGKSTGYRFSQPLPHRNL